MSAKKTPKEDLRFQRQVTRLALLNGLMNGRSITVDAAAPSRAKPTEVLPPGGRKPGGPTAQHKAKPPVSSKEKTERPFMEAVEEGSGKLKKKPGPRPKPEPKPGSAEFKKKRKEDIEKAKVLQPTISPETVTRRDKYKGNYGEQQLATMWTQKKDPKTGKDVPDYTSTYTGSERGRIVPAGEQHPNLWYVEVKNPGVPDQPQWIRMHTQPINKSRARKLALIGAALVWSQDPATGQIIEQDDKEGQAKLKQQFLDMKKVITDIDKEEPERVTWQSWDSLSPEVQDKIQRMLMNATHEEDVTRKIFGGKITPENAKMLMESKDVRGKTIETRLKNAIKIGLKLYSKTPAEVQEEAKIVAKETADITTAVQALGKGKGRAKVLDLRTGLPWDRAAVEKLYHDSDRDVKATVAAAKKHYADIKKLVKTIKDQGVVRNDEGLPIRLHPGEVAELYYEAGADPMATIELAKQKYTSEIAESHKEEEQRAAKREKAKTTRRKKDQKRLKEVEMGLTEEKPDMPEEPAAEPTAPAEPTPARVVGPGEGRQIGTGTWSDWINHPKLYNIIALRNGEAITNVETGEWSDEKDKQVFMGAIVPMLKSWLESRVQLWGADLNNNVTNSDVVQLVQEARQLDKNPYFKALADYFEQIISGDPFSSAPIIPPHERVPEEPFDEPVQEPAEA